jgi:hypothetical protein
VSNGVKIVGGVLLVFIVMLFGGWISERFFSNNSCVNEVVSQQKSPNNNYKAILFTRDCGPKTSTSYQVSVMNQWENLSNSSTGNAFVSYEAPEIKWKDNSTLYIVRASGAEVFKAQKEIIVWPFFQKVKFEYSN